MDTTADTATTTVFSAEVFDIVRTLAKIEQVTARAQAKGLEGGWTYRIEEREVGGDELATFLVVEGTAPRLRGWTLVASVTWEGDSPIVATVPGYAGPLVDRSTLDGHYCDICRTDRNRTKVLVVEHPQQGRKVVGGQCVKDLLGHDLPVVLAEVQAGLPGEGWGLGQGPRKVRTSRLVAVAVAATRVWGWVPSSDIESTRGKVAFLENGSAARALSDRRTPAAERGRIREALALVSEVGDEVEAILAWASSLEPSSEFNRNLAALAQEEFVGWERVGILAYSPTGYARHLGREAERAAATESEQPQVLNQALAEAGTKVTEIAASIIGVRFIEGDYGSSTLVKFGTPQGHQVAWFASSTWITEEHIGLEVVIQTATVKGTNEFRGDLETQITRAQVIPSGDPEQVRELGEDAWKSSLCVGGYHEPTRAVTWAQGEIRVSLTCCDKHRKRLGL